METRSCDRSFTSARETLPSKCSSFGLKTRASESERGNEMSPPTPPRRLLRKKPLCVNRRCQWQHVRESSVCCTPSESPKASVVNREFSADSLLERVERTHEALELAHRRWCRHEHEHNVPAS